jgi:hypothetical protein
VDKRFDKRHWLPHVRFGLLYYNIMTVATLGEGGHRILRPDALEYNLSAKS